MIYCIVLFDSWELHWRRARWLLFFHLFDEAFASMTTMSDCDEEHNVCEASEWNELCANAPFEWNRKRKKVDCDSRLPLSIEQNKEFRRGVVARWIFSDCRLNSDSVFLTGWKQAIMTFVWARCLLTTIQLNFRFSKWVSNIYYVIRLIRAVRSAHRNIRVFPIFTDDWRCL